MNRTPTRASMLALPPVPQPPRKAVDPVDRDHYIRLDSNGDTTNTCNPDHVEATAALGRDRIALVYRPDRTTEMERDDDGAVAY
ncbi:hypothetical protein HYG77_12445 [Rhodococcus sp. ZPP]|uniref:hypothetical protein n=1 Tax=Rhodococcus sp. ZPP TaxID=2749906 RepID=UPI001AD87CCC|nr:hypothetical protein [Rhodococcus sp. ZPP]QTJ66331.1 hypothetical protein HYG77_12445 [Rhodococcus sp. ZPP]